MVRIKHRYLLFHILYPSSSNTAKTSTSSSATPNIVQFAAPTSTSLTTHKLASLVRESLALNFGDWGVGVAGSVNVKYLSHQTSTGIIRIARDHYRTVWAALTYLRELEGREVVFKIIRVSGTIKKAELAAIAASEKLLERLAEEEGAKKGQTSKPVVEDVFMVDSDVESTR